MANILSEWYWIMPNTVLYSKELTDKQKLLYCLISSLCAEKWYCRASNEYLWELLNAEKGTISKNVSKLNEKWFIALELEGWFQRKISIVENDIPLVKNDKGGSQKWLGGVVKNDNIILQYNNTNNKYSFQEFRKEYPHARKWKKAESEKYFNQNDSEDVRKQVQILNRKIKAWLQDAQYIPACERWIRDFTPISDEVLKQDLVKIARWHLKCGWDIKQRALELKQTFWEAQINEIVKAIQQKPTLSFN